MDNTITQLHRTIKFVRMLDEADSCIEFLTNAHSQQIILILPNDIDQIIMNRIHDIPQLDTIYIFSNSDVAHEKWSKQWKKVKGMFNDISLISNQLKQNVYRYEQNSTPISIVSTSSAINFNELNASFMYTQLLKEILLEMEHNEQAKAEFVEFCRVNVAEINTTLDVIDEFDRNFDNHSPIWWYTKDIFIYSMLNSALRTQNIEIILKLGFFIRDLYRQIEQIYSNLHQTTKMTVYRGQGMSTTDFDKIKMNEGGLLSFNNFLSTSDNQEISLMFADSARQNSDLIGVFFRMEIDPSISSIPFAVLDDISYFSDSEREILFSMHTVFRIGKMQQIEDRLWEVKLCLTSDNDEQLQHLTDYMHQEIRQLTWRHNLSTLMIKIGEFDRAELLFNHVLETTGDDELEHLGYLYLKLGSVHNGKGNLRIALSYYQKALEIHQKVLPSTHPYLITEHSNIAMMYYSSGNCCTALIHFEKALEMQQKSPTQNDSNLATIYNNIGATYNAMGEYSTALVYYQKTFKMQQKVLPSIDPTLATTYSNMASVHCILKSYTNALSNLEKALEIQQKSLPLIHPALATTYSNIAVIHNEMGDYATALSFCQKALEIQEKTLPANHSDLAITYNNMGSALHQKGDFSTALSSYRKALEIQQKVLPSNHPALATTYSNIGLMLKLAREYSSAL
ncbi:unnamed protein product [Rotaria sp. Silwood1]|nr:unnamed protein product [Rotaria sp. Silwood1]